MVLNNEPFLLGVSGETAVIDSKLSKEFLILPIL